MTSLLREIDHVGIAVNDLETAIDWYETVFGAELMHRETVDSQGVEEALLAVAESYIQLLTPLTQDSPVGRFLQKRGEGIHHVAYRVDDCASALQTAKASGVMVVDEEPKPGSRGTTVAFLHPRDAFGTLIELVEEPSGLPE